MTKEIAIDIILDALKDSLIVLGFVFLVYIILSFFEVKIAKRLSKTNKYSPILGSLFALIPQCGISVVASDLYIKEHITMGTLVAVFLSCSDEAVPLLLASHNQKALMVIPLLVLKFIIGFLMGYLIDLLIRDKKHVDEHLEHCHHEEEVHVGCCHHHIDDDKESRLHKNFLHPLVHSLKIFIYVLIINLIFGFLIELIGEDSIKNFLQTNKYLSPLFCCIIGLIPNCASSVFISELFVIDGISFGACLGGLLVNSGLGLVYLLKSKKKLKSTLLIISVCFLTSIVVSYLTCLIYKF